MLMYPKSTLEQPVDLSSHSERDQRILQHLNQVKLIASRIHDRVPESVCLDDLISAGVLGLIDAVDHFDDTLDIKLKTYAEHKIRGAILDSLRSLDWAPRNKRRKSKQIESTIGTLEKTLQRAPTEDEVAEQLSITLKEYRGWLVEIRGINLAPMEQGPSGDSEGSSVLRFISDNEDEWPSALLEQSELRRVIAELIERLPEVERTIITLYYGKEFTLRQIASVVNLHETRVSQLKSQAILRLRSAMHMKWPH